MRPAVAACAACAAVALALAFASAAGAVEREHHLGADLGGSMLVTSIKTDLGGGGGGHWTYGLTDAFNLMVEGAWSIVALGEKVPNTPGPRTRAATVANVDAGMGYVLDVGQWVPYAGGLVGGYALAAGNISGTKVLPGVGVALGLDYRLTRSWAAGLAFRQHFLVTEMSTYPSFTQLFARFEYTWGW